MTPTGKPLRKWRESAEEKERSGPGAGDQIDFLTAISAEDTSSVLRYLSRRSFMVHLTTSSSSQSGMSGLISRGRFTLKNSREPVTISKRMTPMA
jgi:hypothetical protein